ncbi:MAG: carbon-nitrogen hydrolase family protein [Bacillota bacterium]|nr:carbon-nitrogen hydrolase family protein [Bacillota bacterium]
MRIFALELDNDIKGISRRKEYIEDLIRKLPSPGLVVLPELALCSYMASQKAWKYADNCGRDTADWALQTARKYQTFIAAGYLDKENKDYFNRYMIAGPDGVCGFVSKSEGESAVFRRGSFGSVIRTPFGNVAVGICFDSRRRRFYENVKDERLSLILFPHGSPADPGKPEKERRENDARCMKYVEAFGVPVVYVNSTGSLEFMPGKMGALMKKHGFRMNGLSKIYAPGAVPIPVDIPEATASDIRLSPRRRVKDIRFHGDDILPGNWLFRHLILRPDTIAGIRSYEENHLKSVSEI